MKPSLDVTGVLGEVYSIYLDRGALLIAIAFCLLLPGAALEAAATDHEALIPVTLLWWAVATFLIQAAYVEFAREEVGASPPATLSRALVSVAPVLGLLVLTSLLWMLGVTVGILLLVIPGVYLSVLWALVAPVIVVERAGLTGSFYRSENLVDGNWWRVFAIVLASGLTAAVLGLVLLAVTSGLVDGFVSEALVSAICAAIPAPLWALAPVVTYLRLSGPDGAGTD